MRRLVSRRRRWRVVPCGWLIALVVATVVGLPLTAVAQSPSSEVPDRCREEQEGEESKGKNYRTVIGPDGRKVFVIEKAFVVCGKVPKPQVIYVLHASTINYEWETLKRNFLPKVIHSVKQSPF